MGNIKIVITAVTWLMATTAMAQDLPGSETLENIVSEALPSFWTVSELEVIATSRGGDAARPQAQIRFEANANPSANLFAETAREGPFVIVVPTEAQTAVRRLYGYFELS